MSDFFVILVLKTNIYKSKLIVIQYFESLELKHSESNTDILDGHKIGEYLQFKIIGDTNGKLNILYGHINFSFSRLSAISNSIYYALCNGHGRFAI